MIKHDGVTPLGRALTDQADITPQDVRDAQVTMDKTQVKAYPMFHATLLPGEEQHGAPIPDES